MPPAGLTHTISASAATAILFRCTLNYISSTSRRTPISQFISHLLHHGFQVVDSLNRQLGSLLVADQFAHQHSLSQRKNNVEYIRENNGEASRLAAATVTGESSVAVSPGKFRWLCGYLRE